MEQDPGKKTAVLRTSSFSGGVSTFASTITIFPLYKIVFRQQVNNTPVMETMAQLLREGLWKLYRGVAPPMLAQTVKGTIYFGTHNILQHYFSHQAVAGLGTGVVEAVVFTPFERVQSVLQNGRHNHLSQQRVLVLLKSEPFGHGFYRAFLAIAARNALGSGIYFGLKDPVRDAFGQLGLPRLVSSFASGIVTSMMISLPLYPLSVLVANMQADVGQKDARCGLRASAGKLWEARGRSVALLYRGGSLVILRSCVSWGITTAIYDLLMKDSSD